MLKKFFAVVLGVGLAVSLSAQSNERLDELLAQGQARLDTTAYLLLSASGQISEDSDPAAAFEAALSSGLIAKTSQPADGVSIELLSFLVMKTQKLSGGLEWMFLPSPRAAYRELAYHNAINVTAGPRRLVAGDEVIRVLAAASALKGAKS